MSPAGFEPAIQASERQQTVALDRSATGIDRIKLGNRQSCVVVFLDLAAASYSKRSTEREREREKSNKYVYLTFSTEEGNKCTLQNIVFCE